MLGQGREKTKRFSNLEAWWKQNMIYGLDYVINSSLSFQGQKGDPGLSPGKARNGQKVKSKPVL